MFQIFLNTFKLFKDNLTWSGQFHMTQGSYAKVLPFSPLRYFISFSRLDLDLGAYVFKH